MSTTAETVPAAVRTTRTDSGIEKPATRTRRTPTNADEENNGCARYFLAKANGDGSTPALDREVATEGEALVESLRLGVTYYAIQEFRVIPDFAGRRPQLKKKPFTANRTRGIQILSLASKWRLSMSTAISARQQAALERLIRIAQADTGQSRMTAEFLLSWWNASNCGGFDLTTLWGVDTEIAADMVTVFTLVASYHRYPDDLGYGEEFRRIVHAWRPALQHG